MELKQFALSFENMIKDLRFRQKKMLITTHRYLDGDAFGSSIALGLMLRKWNVASTLVLVPFIPDKFQFLRYKSNLHTIEPRYLGQEDTQGYYTGAVGQYFSDKITDYEALAILDCAGFSQIPKEVWALGHQFPYIINIDHHMGYTLDLPENRILNLVENATSTCEVLFHLMEAIKMEMDKDISLPLYIGAQADLRKNAISKNSSRYPKKIISQLNEMIRQFSGDMQAQIEDIFTLDPWEKKLLEISVAGIRSAGNIVYAVVDPNMVQKAKQETDSLDNPRMPFHEFHIRLRQQLNEFKNKFQIVVIFDQILGKVSLYDLTKTAGIDLAAISRELGEGGGHLNRAGFTFQTAREKLLADRIVRAKDSDSVVIDAMVRFIGEKTVEMIKSTSNGHL